MRYKVSESNVHGCIEYSTHDTLDAAIKAADACQDFSNTLPDDGWCVTFIVTRTDNWYPGDHVKRYYETTPNKTRAQAAH